MLVLGANLALDRTLRIARLVPGHVQRPESAVATAGGKSVNVLRAVAAHGVGATLVANLPGRAGGLLAELLHDEGHDVVPVRTAGEARTAVIILEADGRVTVLNEPGPELSPSDAAALLAALATALAAGLDAPAAGPRVLVASGSLPPGAADDTYARVVELGHRNHRLVVVDAARDALAGALAARPDVVSPNLAEAESVLWGHPDESVEPTGDGVRGRALDAATALRERGARAALVSAGRHGLAGADAAGAFWLPAARVGEVNPVGAGDALVGGLAVGLEAGLPLREAAAVGVATAAASVAHPLAGGVEPAVLRSLLGTLRWEAA
jgi:1-phosphofructokinase family hexose kinase